MSTTSQKRSFLFSMTLSEMVLLMFFSLLLLTTLESEILRKDVAQAQEKAETFVREWTSLVEAISIIRKDYPTESAQAPKDEDFIRLVRQKRARLQEKAETLAHERTPLVEAMSIIRNDYPTESAQAPKDEDFIRRVRQKRARLADEATHRETRKQLVERVAEKERRIGELEQAVRAATKDGREIGARLRRAENQLQSFGQGGRDHPPCWLVTAEGPTLGTIEYMYAITIREQGYDIRSVWPDHREEEAATIPGARAVSEAATLTSFRNAASKVLGWSKRHDCRHYVRVSDEAESKQAFKNGLLTIEDYFYKYLED